MRNIPLKSFVKDFEGKSEEELQRLRELIPGIEIGVCTCEMCGTGIVGLPFSTTRWRKKIFVEALKKDQREGRKLFCRKCVGLQADRERLDEKHSS